ncbi:ATP-grasp domain-containing protein [Cohnella fermenti]|uniref:ATP-grasp domain-containing protein n=1 Tax=Cohnella fermenti TaxID=2565925 RepID=A0A4S4C1E5_9BACL|nr:ATP-grasp domain-containing protein [Cohnella fermenti]THF80784.1 ATP-grasp domain-containing protein [Cohnella fermenti]
MAPSVLFTTIGRRVQLARHFIDNGWIVYGTDSNPEDCAGQGVINSLFKVPRCDEPNYYDSLITICRTNVVNYVIPLFEPEMLELAKRKEEFAQYGANLVLSDEESLNICLDKYKLAQFFIKAGIPTPETFKKLEQIDAKTKWVIKPRTGMGGKDVHIVDSNEVHYFSNKVSNPIYQRYIPGQEYSIDVFITKEGRVLSVVPRLRLEVRSGEVSKSVTVKDEAITRLTIKLLNKLRINGPATIQGIKDNVTGQFYFIEINPRFGGGVPLTMEAGIPYADFLGGDYEQQLEVLHPYQVGLKMLRYDDAIFVSDKGMGNI